MDRFVHTGPKFKVNITKQFPTKTKNFPIKTLLEMIDSSVKSLGDVEYDKQNCLQHQEIRVWLKNSKCVLPSIATVHKSVHTKKDSN